MKKGDEVFAPWEDSWLRVKIEGVSSKGTTLVKWLDGPLAGKSARLVTRTLKRKSGGTS